jgi:ATP-dependent Clp protease adaptor protein ClpS
LFFLARKSSKIALFEQMTSAKRQNSPLLPSLWTRPCAILNPGAPLLGSLRRTAMSQFPPDQPLFPSDSADSSGKRPLRPGPLPPCRLVIVKNETDDLMRIVNSIMELTRFCRPEATHRMWEAHHCGRSLLLITYRERAELLVEQFAGRGVTVVIEPA